MYRGNCLKRRLGQFVDLRGGAWCFWRGLDAPVHTMKLDSLLHKRRIEVLRLDMCTSMISLSKIAHLKCDAITHSAKETRQHNEQWGWGWRQQGRRGVNKIWRRWVGIIGGGLHKIRELGIPLPTMACYWMLL